MKKVLKTVGKVVGWFFAVIFGIPALLSVVTLCWAIGPWTAGTVTESLPVTPEDFVPTVRLIAFTDPHNNNKNVADAVDTAYLLFDNDPVYAGVDGIFGIGEFTSVGLKGITRIIRRRCSSTCGPRPPASTCWATTSLRWIITTSCL